MRSSTETFSTLHWSGSQSRQFGVRLCHQQSAPTEMPCGSTMNNSDTDELEYSLCVNARLEGGAINITEARRKIAVPPLFSCPNSDGYHVRHAGELSLHLQICYVFDAKCILNYYLWGRGAPHLIFSCKDCINNARGEVLMPRLHDLEHAVCLLRAPYLQTILLWKSGSIEAFFEGRSCEGCRSLRLPCGKCLSSSHTVQWPHYFQGDASA